MNSLIVTSLLHKYRHETRKVCHNLILPLLLLPARRRGSAGMTSNSGEVVLLAGVGDAVVAATAGCSGGISVCEVGVRPWSGDNDIYGWWWCGDGDGGTGRGRIDDFVLKQSGL